MRARNLTKILGLSLLVAVGAMAVSASAAQAKWLLLKSGVSVLDLKLKGTVGLTELLANGIEIHCPTGDVTALLQLNAGPTPAAHTVLTGSGTVTFLECKVLKSETKCTVKSPGQAAGTIVASGSGTGAMSGEEVYAKISSAEFTEILITGALCPVDGTEEPASGTVKMTVGEPLVDKKVHGVTLVGEGLKFGESNATLHGALIGGGPSHDAFVTALVEEETGATSAVHLVGL